MTHRHVHGNISMVAVVLIEIYGSRRIDRDLVLEGVSTNLESWSYEMTLS